MAVYDCAAERAFAAEKTEMAVADCGKTEAAAVAAAGAFDQLIIAELPFLRRAARRWYREKAKTDDLVQDTVLQALANAHLWRAGSNLRGWLFTIMRNQFLAARIRESRFELSADDTVFEGNAPSAGLAEARLALRDVERVLRRLPEAQRTAISLIALDGKSYDEAASEMGISVAAVRCHLARGRERLRSAVYAGGEVVPFRRRSARFSAFAPDMIVMAAE